MKEINLETFTHIDDAILWLETELQNFYDMGYGDLKGEIALVNNEWRVGIITNTAQKEFNFDSE